MHLVSQTSNTTGTNSKRPCKCILTWSGLSYLLYVSRAVPSRAVPSLSIVLKVLNHPAETVTFPFPPFSCSLPVSLSPSPIPSPPFAGTDISCCIEQRNGGRSFCIRESGARVLSLWKRETEHLWSRQPILTMRAARCTSPHLPSCAQAQGSAMSTTAGCAFALFSTDSSASRPPPRPCGTFEPVSNTATNIIISNIVQKLCEFLQLFECKSLLSRLISRHRPTAAACRKAALGTRDLRHPAYQVSVARHHKHGLGGAGCTTIWDDDADDDASASNSSKSKRVDKQ